MNGLKELKVGYGLHIHIGRNGPMEPTFKDYKDVNTGEIFYIDCNDFDPCSLKHTYGNITYIKTTNLLGSIKYKILSENKYYYK